jgi:Fe-S oxidoreductase
MKLVHDIRYASRDRGDLLSALESARAAKDVEEVAALEGKLENLKPLVADGAEGDHSLGYLGTEALWSCTTCGACQEHCPVLIEHPMKILEMRTNLVLAQESMPQELANAFKGIERNMNPWGIGLDKRMDWIDEDTPVLDEVDPIEFEYLFFVGCAGSYDNRCQKQSHALLKVMKAAGVKVAVAPEEVCCGDPARRPGNEFIFQMMAQQNIETFNNYGVKKIVTFCPHCYHTLKNEYPQLGGDYEVLHHSELIADLLDEGRLELPRGGEPRVVTYHDSCYLGRWNHIYDAPRDVVEAVPGTRLVELDRNGRHSFCCGAGGGRFWMEEESPRVNENRAQEIIKKLPGGKGVVALNCPFCTTMITDGLKAFDKDEDIKVMDIAELVAAALPGATKAAVAEDSAEAED